MRFGINDVESQGVGREDKVSFRKTILNFCDATTAHGLGRVSSAKWWPVRVFWLLAFCACSAYCFSQIVTLVKLYYSFPSITKFKLNHQLRITFPAITFCNINPLDHSAIRNNSSLWTLITKMQQSEANKTNGDDTEADQRRENLERVLYYMTRYSDEQLKAFGHQGQDMIVSCQAPGHLSQYPCDSKNFTWFHDKIHGNCFTFNAAKSKASPIFIEDTGHRVGFQMTLFVESDEYWAYLSESLGFLISIHDPDEQPFPEETGYFIAPGTSTSIALQSKLLKRLPWPYDGENCEKRRTVPPDDTMYSEVSCRKKCVAKAMLDTCKCVSLLYRQKPSCNPFNKSQDACVEKVLRNRDDARMTESCNCPPACVEEKFSTTISSSIWPSSSYVPTLINSLKKANHLSRTIVTNLTTARDNMAHIMVYFSTMTQESIVQKPAYQVESLLGDIGGQMGLFIGISVLTLVEFVALIWELITLFIFKNKSQSKQISNHGNATTQLHDVPS